MRMPQPALIARPVTVVRGQPLRGRFKLPPEPLLFATAALLAATARGTSVFYLDASMLDATLGAIRQTLTAIGAPPTISDDRWEISGMGTLGFLAPAAPLDFTSAGRALAVALGALGPYQFATDFESASEDQHLVRSVIDALRPLGVDVLQPRTGRLPARLRGPRTLVPYEVRIGRPTAELKAALLLAALTLPGISRFTEGQAAPDHAERLFRYFGAPITESSAADGSRVIDVRGLTALGARTLTVPGDPDLAALPLLAGLIVPDSDLVIENMLMHPARGAVLTALDEMGGHIDIVGRRSSGGEEVVDLRVRHSPLLGTSIPAQGLTAAALPVLAVAGAFAAGETRLPVLADPAAASMQQRLATVLAANGATVRLERGGLVVGRPAPGQRLGGGKTEAGDEPLLTGALLALGLAAGDPVDIADTARLQAAYPDLLGQLEAAGAAFDGKEAA